ncbi:MAG TPA: hypothetical protein VIK38_05595, partial [Coriobacteriia bacterium]
MKSGTRIPPIPNAENSAADALAVKALFAAMSSSRSTIVGRNARSAASKNVERMAARNATAYSWPRPRTPANAATGIEPRRTAR